MVSGSSSYGTLYRCNCKASTIVTTWSMEWFSDYKTWYGNCEGDINTRWSRLHALPYPNHELAILSDALHNNILFDVAQCRPIDMNDEYKFGISTPYPCHNAHQHVKTEDMEDVQAFVLMDPRDGNGKTYPQWLWRFVDSGRIKCYLAKEVMDFDC